MQTARKLDQIWKQLPAEAKGQVEDFASFLLEKKTKKRSKKQKNFNFKSLSKIVLDTHQNPHPIFKTEDDIYETIQWGETDVRKQKQNLKNFLGIFPAKAPADVSKNVDSYLYD